MKLRKEATNPDLFNKVYQNTFNSYLNMRHISAELGCITVEMDLKPEFLNPNGMVHGGCIASFADTCAGDSTIAHMPENAKMFTTLEFKCNFVRAARAGVLVAKSKAIHVGRTTQVWQVEVLQKETDKLIATFNCTQLVMY